MLPRSLRLRARRIQREGDPATGVVTAVDARRGGGVDVTVRVDLPGGAGATVTRALTAADLGSAVPAVGDRLPVRYDRHRPERVELDVDTMRARHPS